MSSVTDWVVTCGRNVQNGTLGLANGVVVATGGHFAGNLQLVINSAPALADEVSDWQLSKLYVWDRHLPDDVFTSLSDLLMDYLTGSALNLGVQLAPNGSRAMNTSLNCTALNCSCTETGIAITNWPYLLPNSCGCSCSLNQAAIDAPALAWAAPASCTNRLHFDDGTRKYFVTRILRRQCYKTWYEPGSCPFLCFAEDCAAAPFNCTFANGKTCPMTLNFGRTLDSTFACSAPVRCVSLSQNH